MLDASYYEKADEIIARYTAEERSLIPIIQDVQETYHYLPPELLGYIAQKIGITETKAFSVASFYENFSFETKGKYASATAPPAMSARPFPYWSACGRSWASARPSTPRTICCSPWRRSPVWAPAVWRRPSWSTSMSTPK